MRHEFGFSLEDFIEESNRIEDIHEVTQQDRDAHLEFLAQPEVTVRTLEAFVYTICGKALRRHRGQDVIVGRYRPPPGGPRIVADLEALLAVVNAAEPAPNIFGETAKPRRTEPRWQLAYDVHQSYESLHPFMDGNGRSGRALWLKMVGGMNYVPLGFLHTWYYHSLRWGGKRGG